MLSFRRHTVILFLTQIISSKFQVILLLRIGKIIMLKITRRHARQVCTARYSR